MDTSKMREQFEAAYTAYCEKNGVLSYTAFNRTRQVYINTPTELAWQMWQDSREAVVVELPQGLCMFDRSGGRAPGGLPLIELKQAADAIEAAGLKYEVMP